MTKILKKLILILLLAGMTNSVIPVSANEALGSITIILEDTANELSKENVEFGLTKVADIVHGEYISSEEYSQFDLNTIETSVELKDTARKIEKIISSSDYFGMTNNEGILKFENLEVGVYLLHPIYIADYEVIEPTLVAIPTWNESEGIMNHDVLVFPKHEPLPVVQIRKVDSSSNSPIKNRDFEFTLYLDSSCNNIYEIIEEDNKDGIINFDITYGTYYLKETKAPDGYNLSNEIVKIEFVDDGIYINDKHIEKTDGVYNFDFENVKIITTTPSTSDDFNIILWQCLIAFSLITISILIVINQSKDEDDSREN